jgi:ABC-type dipeptide/oligopeptide/nickel transport system ATPase component
MSDRVAVMTSGHIVETGPAVEIYERPKHEYTRTLLAAIPADTPTEARRRRTGEARAVEVASSTSNGRRS